MRILSLSLVYPNPAEPGLGLFVESRLKAISKFTSVAIVAPVPLIDYSSPQKHWLNKSYPPVHDANGELSIYRPRWIFPPGGTPINVICLFLRVLLLIWRRPLSRFDILDVHFGYPEGVAGALLALVFRRAFVITLRGSETAFSRSWWRRKCMAWAFPRAAAVITVSRALGSFAAGLGVDPSRIHTIPNGINRNIMYPRNRAAARVHFGFSDDTKVIVSAGELIEAKGHHLVIQSVRHLLASSNYKIVLGIAGGVARGGKPFVEELQQLTRDLDLTARVTFFGWLEPPLMSELMSAADVFCLASYSEGWPNVINEALACGTPVVASRVGAVPQMIPSDDYGYIVPIRDQSALTEAISLALSRTWDRELIAQLGGSRSWQNVAREVLGVLREINSRSAKKFKNKALFSTTERDVWN